MCAQHLSHISLTLSPGHHFHCLSALSARKVFYLPSLTLPRAAGATFPCHRCPASCPAWGGREHSSLQLPAVSIWVTLSPSNFTC